MLAPSTNCLTTLSKPAITASVSIRTSSFWEFSTRLASAALAAAATCNHSSRVVVSWGLSFASTSAAGPTGLTRVIMSGIASKAIALLPKDKVVVVVRGWVAARMDCPPVVGDGNGLMSKHGLTRMVFPRLVQNCSWFGKVQYQFRKTVPLTVGCRNHD